MVSAGSISTKMRPRHRRHVDHAPTGVKAFEILDERARAVAIMERRLRAELRGDRLTARGRWLNERLGAAGFLETPPRWFIRAVARAGCLVRYRAALAGLLIETSTPRPLGPGTRPRGPTKRSLVAVRLGELELGAAVLIEEGMRDHVEAVG